MIYPEAKRLDVVDEFHGTLVIDPYRWLEDERSAETAAWNVAEDALTRPYLDRLPGRDLLRLRLRELIVGDVGLPRPRGDRVFFTRRDPAQELAGLWLREPDGTERALIDPNALSHGQTVTLDFWSVSADGTKLAYELSEGGDEETTIYIRDVDTSELLDDPIDRTRAGSFAWTPDGLSYYYVRDCSPTGHCWRGNYHVGVVPTLGGPAGSDELIFGEGREQGRVLRRQRLTRRSLVDDHRGQGQRPHERPVHRRPTGGGTPRAVVEGVQAATGGEVCEDDGQLLLHTNLDAPNGRLVRTDPSTPTPEHWHDRHRRVRRGTGSGVTDPRRHRRPPHPGSDQPPPPLRPRHRSRSDRDPPPWTGDSGRHIHDLGPRDP